MKMAKKQSALFPQDAIKIIDEMDLKEAERIASLVKATVESLCGKVEVFLIHCFLLVRCLSVNH